jgi:hypothetical protein
MRSLALLALVILTAVSGPTSALAAPVRVRSPEGAAHGFLVLRGTKAEAIAHGDWWQIPNGERLEVHLRFRFTDGSSSHETFVLVQRRVWTLLSYRSVQKGPSFPRDVDGQVDRETGRYTVRVHDREKDTTKVDEGALDLPEDAYGFGMLAVLLKNLEPGETMAAHAIAFTPKPRILKLEVTPDGEDTIAIEGQSRHAPRYVARAELGGAMGAVASIVGKQPPPVRFWMAGDPVSTFVRVDTPFYPDGPIWRVELAAPRWRDDTRR